MNPPVYLVSATRMEAEAFGNGTLLGRSLQQPQHRSLLPLITYANRDPLAVAYNAAIATAPAEALLIFCHDDVDLGPDPLDPQLDAAFCDFDLVGVAGNQRRQSGQMAWWLDGASLQWDHSQLSGGICHGQPGAAKEVRYGPARLPVELLDGVFLAARAGVLQKARVRFDPRFGFHFYDLDLCRTARQQGLRLGTWPLRLVHASGGDAFTMTWLEALERYQSKWSEPQRAPEIDRYVRFRQGRALEGEGRWPEAETTYRQLLTEQPRHCGLLLRLSAVQHQQGKTQEALAALDTVLAIDPGLARAHANRGTLLQLAGDLDGAAASLRHTLTLQPSLERAADNLLLLARQLQAIGRLADAVEAQRAVLRAAPTRPDMLLDLGSTLMAQGKVEAARACFARLLRHHPHHPGAQFQMALALESLGEFEAALELHQVALAADPESAEVRLALELVRLHGCDWDDYDQRMERLRTSLEAWLAMPNAPALSPLRPLYFPLPLAVQRRISERWAAAQGPGATLAAAAPTPAANPSPANPPEEPRSRRLRIGYLSADFRNHAMGTLIHGLFRHHDRERFEVFAYAINDLCDAYTRSVQQGVEHFTVVASDTNEQLADRIRTDQIDVLIDLMGHTHHSRPGVLAQRPAPLQLHYLGFPGPLGCYFIDGVIADAWLIPHDQEAGYGDRIHRLPWGFVSSPPPIEGQQLAPPEASDPPPTRACLGLSQEQVVLACFNRAEKIDPGSFRRWLEVLLAAPQAVLLLVIESPIARQRLLQRAEEAGVDPARLVFTAQVASHTFPSLCRQADLLLDTALYGVGATGVAALAAGLPLITCPGVSFASRMGASLCAAAGLEELICPSPEAYTALAIELAQQPSRLRQLREQLGNTQAPPPLFDTAAWVGHLEALLQQLVAPDDTAAGLRNASARPRLDA
jgi:protein O-GlcNAc transferase